MPTLPASVAARAERWFGRAVTVTGAEPLSPNLRRVTFAGEALRGRSWRPGHEVEFRVSDRDLRHYTPARFDPVTGTFEVIFCTLAGGPGSRWATGLRPGDEVSVIGPSAGFRLKADGRPVLLGDASTIGLFTALAGAGIRPSGAVEVPAVDRAATAALLPDLVAVSGLAEPGDALTAWAQRAPLAGSRVYLAGHARTLQRIRAALRAGGMPRDRIATKAYWATGRTGL